MAVLVLNCLVMRIPKTLKKAGNNELKINYHVKVGGRRRSRQERISRLDLDEVEDVKTGDQRRRRVLGLNLLPVELEGGFFQMNYSASEIIKK